jgi:GT2 family glycosyltransferase
MRPKVSITIVNYNTKELLLYNLKKIQEVQIKVPYEVIVLDNNSKDGSETVEEIKARFPEVRIIEETENTGYTKGVNNCIRAAKGEYILNLNPDILIQPENVETMADYLDTHPEVGLLGPRLLNFDGTPQNSCFRFLTLEIALYRRTPLGKLPRAKKILNEFLLEDNWNHDKIREVDWILGAAFMFPKELVEKNGLLDERFFLYLSDTDFAWNLWKTGKKVVFYPDVEMYHYHRKSSAGSGFSPFKLLLNRAYRLHISDGVKFFLKHAGEKPPHYTESL